MKKGLSYIAVGFFSVLLIYTMWQIGRKINYSVSYEDMVKTTIQEMVKKETLK